MKDLYKRLHVEPDANEAEIRAALAGADAESRAAAEYILLEPARRRVYDRHHRLLTTVAQLRSRLALGLRPFWSHGQHSDFNVPMTAKRTPANLEAMRVMEATEWRRKRSGGVWGVVVGVLIAGALGVWYWVRHH